MKQAKRIFVFAAMVVCYSMLIGIVALSVFSKDEGTLGDNIILNIIADYLYFISIPAFVLMGLLAKSFSSNITIFIWGILLTAMFYTAVTMGIIRIIRNRKTVL